MTTINAKLGVVLASATLFLGGCTSPGAVKVQNAIHGMGWNKVNTDFNVRPAWIEHPDPDDRLHAYCYGQFENTESYIRSVVPGYEGGGWQTKSEKAKVKKEVDAFIQSCLRKKLGENVYRKIGHKRYFLGVTTAHSEYWFGDRGYTYAKIIISLPYVERLVRQINTQNRNGNNYDYNNYWRQKL